MTIKRIFKVIGIIFASFVLFILAYLLFAFLLSGISTEKETENSKEIAIFILSNGVHTDIVVPVRTAEIDWSKKIKFENTIAKDTFANLLAFGWGDKGFYLETPQWSDLKFSTAFKACFALSSSAIHATFYNKLIEGEKCKQIMISNIQYKKLVKYIMNSLLLDENGFPLLIKTNANYGNYDAFYEGIGRYNLFYTCNTWTNNALKVCGQKACIWTPFSKGIFRNYK
ncbi:MAG: TIGR02117 family protein [Bacteroidales bacterium]